MQYILNSQKYIELSREIYSLINAELDNVEDLGTIYPKLVIMYEFFRLIRGEAFTNFREPSPEFQKDLYEMEDKIFQKLKELKKKLPENDSKTKFYFENLISMGLKL